MSEPLIENKHDLTGLALDPVTIVLRECTTLAAAMNKYTKYAFQSTGVASLLTRRIKNEEKEAQLFNNYRRIASGEHYHFSGGNSNTSAQSPGSVNTNNYSFNPQNGLNNDPLLYGFLQLKSMLTSCETLDDIDALTILQPFLLIVSTSTTSGYVTNLALVAIHKILFQYKVIGSHSLNYNAALRNVMISLTHCRFEGSEQMTDDSVLLKVLGLIQCIFTSESGELLSDSGVYEVLQTVLSLACNKRRTEVLRKAAESTMLEITIKLFTKLRTIPSTLEGTYINDENYAHKNLLQDDMMGNSNDLSKSALDGELESEPVFEHQGSEPDENQKQKLSVDNTDDEKFAAPEHPYGLPVIKDYLGILIFLITPENSLKHNYSTRVLSLQLLNAAIELSGDCFPSHPSLFTLVSDPIFKNVVYVIKNSRNTKPTLLQTALQTFVTLTLVLGDYLDSQIEFALKIILDIVQSKEVDQMSPVIKELLMEHISMLWTRSKPSFFTKLFVHYDCTLDKSDVCINFIKSLSHLSLPEVAEYTADTVPPICLDGIVTLVEDVYNSLSDFSSTDEYNKTNSYLDQRTTKTNFIEAATAFNEKPKKGIPLLIEGGFIKKDSELEIAKFLFENKGRLNKKTVGEYIANPKNKVLLKHFIDNFDFKNLRVDEAIRILLTKFRLPGESQQIERIVECFSAKYVADQSYDPSKENCETQVEGDYSSIQPDPDSVLVLSFSIIMLNTDLHNPQIKKHMTFDDYSYNLNGCNNQKNFPMWYLEKMYTSIKDKEIVMPEEHHGNEEWFDDAWNNLISSLVVFNKNDHEDYDNISDLSDPITLLQFDRSIFDHVGCDVMDALFTIFEIATDDHVSITILSAIDKCCFIASHYGLFDLYNDIIERLISVSGLTGNKQIGPEGSEGDDIPLSEIITEAGDSFESLSVSKYSVMLGRNYKGQLASILLFRVMKLNDSDSSISEQNWIKISEIIFQLFKNKMITPDIFVNFQKSFKLPSLPKPSAEHTIKKSEKINGSKSGFLSTFASYLKGDDEPNFEEISSSTIASNCIDTCDLQTSLWKNEKNFSSGLFINVLLKKLDESTSDQEILKLFIMDLIAGLYFEYSTDNIELGESIMHKLLSVTQNGQYSKAFALRVLVYKMCMLRKIPNGKIMIDLLDNEILKHNEIYDDGFFENKNVGGEFLKRILEFAHLKASNEELFQNESFWKVLRKFASFHKHTLTVYEFVAQYFLTDSIDCINTDNFMWLLGLLDEISSIGAIGSQWENEYDRLVKTGHKVTKENPYQEIVSLSLKSINTTAHLIELETPTPFFTKNEVFALVQALTHQCLNPCYQLRSYAVGEMLQTLLHETSRNNITLLDLIDDGLAPLLDNTQDSKVGILALLSKCYLTYFECGQADDEAYTRVLEVFNKYMTVEPEIETELQKLITEKKTIQENKN